MMKNTEGSLQNLIELFFFSITLLINYLKLPTVVENLRHTQGTFDDLFQILIFRLTTPRSIRELCPFPSLQYDWSKCHDSFTGKPLQNFWKRYNFLRDWEKFQNEISKNSLLFFSNPQNLMKLTGFNTFSRVCFVK